jgi:hypothetical protein
MELSIGSFVTHGEVTGVKTVLSGLSEELITSVFRTIALGPFLVILGLKTSEMKQKSLLKMQSRKLTFKNRPNPAEDSRQNYYPST